MVGIEYLDGLSDNELLKIVDDLQKPTVPENSPLRTASVEIFGNSSTLSMIGVAHPLCKVLAGRMIRYKGSNSSPHIYKM